MKTTSLYRISEISMTSIVPLDNQLTGKVQYFRTMVIKMSDGTEEVLNLFSDNGHNLLISDAELDAILLEPVREAA